MSMPWDKDAEKALKAVPFFARPLVRKKVEERVRKLGHTSVSIGDYKEAEARFRSVMTSKTSEDLKQMMPAENKPGVEMVSFNVCHHKVSNCPNLLIDTDYWRKTLDHWTALNDISEKFRSRIKTDLVYYHQKFHLSISGCPNGCSRPQIADIGVAGFVRPAFNPEKCSGCGDCATACPDVAISMADRLPVFDMAKCLGCTKCKEACSLGCITTSEPEVRVMVAGKLGRNPHLAQTVAEAKDAKQLAAIVEKQVADFLANGLPDERFADFWIRSRR